MNWEAVKHLEDHHIAVYELCNNKFIGPLPGKFREISSDGIVAVNYDLEEYGFLQLTEKNMPIQIFRKNELLFVERK